MTDQMKKGADSELPGWQPKETASWLPHESRVDCSNNATPVRRPEAVGWAPSVWQARWLPPFGDFGSVASCHLTMVDRTKRAATLEPAIRRRRRLGPRGWHPEEKEAQLPLGSKRYSLTSVGIPPRGGAPKTPVREREGTQGPWAAAGCCGNCCYDTGGWWHASKDQVADRWPSCPGRSGFTAQEFAATQSTAHIPSANQLIAASNRCKPFSQTLHCLWIVTSTSTVLSIKVPG